jgi:hypothetical protein
VRIDYFGPIDLLSGFIWLVIILILAQVKYNRNREKEHYRYFLYNVYFKLFFGLAFGVFYVIVTGGGDTTAYWEGAKTLNNLLLQSPVNFIIEMMHSNRSEEWYGLFNMQTGYPPGWIYREPEGWFVSKVASFISLITLKSYWAGTFIFAYVLSQASWKVYELTISFKLHNPFYAALAVLFIPSVSFWCATVSKDAIVLISTFYLIYNLFQIISLDKRASLWNWVAILFFLYFILQTRSAVAMAIFAPVLFAFSARIRRRYRHQPFFAGFLASLTLLIGVGVVIVFLSTQEEVLQRYIDEAAVVQQDFSRNKTYGDKRYDLGITDYSPGGLVRAFPSAVVAGTFRPFIWEALNPTLIINGLESALFMYLTIMFFIRGNVLEKIRQIRKSEFLMYSFYFMLLMAFMSGFTGVIFGVLVRFKAAVLPFLVLVLTAKLGTEMESEK